MSAQHTPGPWWVVDMGFGDFEVDHARGCVCEVRAANIHAEGDAHLIAAAPDLLEAGQRAHTALVVDADEEHVDVVAALGAAIRRATGGAA